MNSADRRRVAAELQELRQERREQWMMLDVLARFRAGDYPHKNRRADPSPEPSGEQ